MNDECGFKACTYTRYTFLEIKQLSKLRLFLFFFSALLTTTTTTWTWHTPGVQVIFFPFMLCIFIELSPSISIFTDLLLNLNRFTSQSLVHRCEKLAAFSYSKNMSFYVIECVLYEFLEHISEKKSSWNIEVLYTRGS